MIKTLEYEIANPGQDEDSPNRAAQAAQDANEHVIRQYTLKQTQ